MTIEIRETIEQNTGDLKLQGSILFTYTLYLGKNKYGELPKQLAIKQINEGVAFGLLDWLKEKAPYTLQREYTRVRNETLIELSNEGKL